jgi:hypothetical protein
MRNILKKPLNITNHVLVNNYQKETKSRKHKVTLSKKMEKIKELSVKVNSAIC